MTLALDAGGDCPAHGLEPARDAELAIKGGQAERHDDLDVDALAIP